MIDTMVAEKRNLTEIEVSNLYGIGIRQLRYMRMRGDGPIWVKISGTVGRRGGRVLYPVSDLDAWMRSRPGSGERSAEGSSK